MINLKENPVEGIEIGMGGLKLIVPPLNAKQLRQFKPELAVLEDKTNTEGHLDALLTLTHASMKRNYPEITAEEVEELVDRGNQTAVMFAVIAGQKVPANLGELLPAMLASLSQR